MSGAVRRFIPLIAFALLAVVLGIGLTLKPREVPSPFIGKQAPAFALPLLDEPTKTLGAADMKGRVWLLNIWASWCAPCREEHPLLVQLARSQAVPIVGLNYKDDPRSAQEWLLKLGNPYQANVVDRDGRASIDYGVYGVPETFIVDQAGIIRHKHIGPLTSEVWQKDLLPLIRKLQP